MKRLVFLIIAVAVAVLMFAATRTWVTGTVSDAVLSDVKVSVAGSSAAPGVFAAALVGAAAGVVALTAGRIARWIAAAFVLLSGVLALISVVMVMVNPDGPVSDQAAATTGRTGSVGAHGTLTPWVWLALAAAILLVAAGVLTLVAVRRWGGLSGRYDAPAGRAPAPVSDWDKLTAGLDPTAERDGPSA